MMLARQKIEKLLIVAKTCPIPSAKYRETVCVAAINRAGELRRLYPIPFRLIAGESQFKKWEWVRAVVSTTSRDQRPESRRLDVDTVEKLSEPISTKNDWQERRSWIEPRLSVSFDALKLRRQQTQKSLGFIKPTRLLGLDITPIKDTEWTEKEWISLTQEGLFDSDEALSRPPLRKIPFEFRYHYECETPSGIAQHRHMVTDWEAGALYWNCVSSHGANWETPFRARLETEFAQKDLIFMMGTVHRFPDQWLIISLIYPPKPKTIPQMQLSFD